MTKIVMVSNVGTDPVRFDTQRILNRFPMRAFRVV